MADKLNLVERYNSLLRYFEKYGYGTFLVKLHGKRPVSVVRIPPTDRLDDEEADLTNSEI